MDEHHKHNCTGVPKYKIKNKNYYLYSLILIFQYCFILRIIRYELSIIIVYNFVGGSPNCLELNVEDASILFNEIVCS